MRDAADQAQATPSPDALLAPLTQLARQAGAAIMPYYRADPEVTHKADASPLTAADAAAEQVIHDGLAAMTPAVPVVAEERAAAHGLPEGAATTFWLVDPLDGTKEFVGERDEFTVNIALIQAGKPVLGVVFVPALDLLYWGQPGRGAQRVDADGSAWDLMVRMAPADGLTVVASRSHGTGDRLEDLLAHYTVAHRRSIGSSLKFCLLAEGAADLYPRFGDTMEWDTAAAHAVLSAAGGRLVAAADGKALTYGKPGFANPAFVALGDPDLTIPVGV